MLKRLEVIIMASKGQQERRGKGREVVRQQVKRHGLEGLMVIPKWNWDDLGKILQAKEF